MLRFAVGQTHAGVSLNGRSSLDNCHSIRRSLGLLALTEKSVSDLFYHFGKCTRMRKSQALCISQPADLDCRASCIIKDVRRSWIQAPDASEFSIKRKADAVLGPASQPPSFMIARQDIESTRRNSEPNTNYTTRRTSYPNTCATV
jgi:hypothetical protein